MRQLVDFFWGVCACGLVVLAWAGVLTIVGLFA
jgi:hypothetical protein